MLVSTVETTILGLKQMSAQELVDEASANRNNVWKEISRTLWTE